MFRPVKLTAEQTAEVARAKATSAATVAASDKQLQEAKKRTSVEGMESHDINLPNISTLSLEGAKRALSLTQTMIESADYKGLSVNAHNGDQPISDLGTYKAVLTDYIGKYQPAASRAAGGESTTASQDSTTAALRYRQMQGMAGNDGNS